MAANSRRGLERYTALVGLVFLVLLIVGTEPFPLAYGGNARAEGDPVRQVSMSLLLVALLPVLLVRLRRVGRLLWREAWLVSAMAWAGTSALWAISPSISIRRTLGSMVIFLICVTLATLRTKTLMRLLLAATGFIVAINWAGVLVLPERAISMDGFWEGVHTTKNGAGYIMAIAAILWLCAAMVHKSRLALGGGLLAVVFLVMTGSKTSIALCALCLLFALAVGRITGGQDRAKSVSVILPLLGMLVAIGLLYGLYQAWLHTLEGEDITLTGRTEIWAYVWRGFLERPLGGWGYGSYWGIGEASPNLREGSGIARVTQAHNGYLDLLATIGLVGLGLTLLGFSNAFSALVSPERALDTPHDRAAVIGFSAIILFMLLHNITESSLLQGLHPVWSLAMICLIGLRAIHDPQRRSSPAKAAVRGRGSSISTPVRASPR